MVDEETKGTAWVTYAGIMTFVAGVVAILDAIWAFRYDDTVADLVLFENDLAIWGWIWLILGVALIAVGLGIFQGQPWARWTGVAFSAFAIPSNLSWAQIQPQQGLIGAILAMLVLYGLVFYGDRVAA